MLPGAHDCIEGLALEAQIGGTLGVKMMKISATTASSQRYDLRLRIDRRIVALHGPSIFLEGPTPLLDIAFETRLRELQGRRLFELAPAEAEAMLHSVGRQLAEVLLPTPIVESLAQQLAQARSHGLETLLGIETDDPNLEALPWEALWLPGEAHPLALTAGIQLYRHVAVPTRVQRIISTGPLRLLIAVASPLGLERRLDLLDMERELARILAALEPVRGKSLTEVTILEQGSLDAIRRALHEEHHHVLHLSCHAQPGQLVLEDALGGPDLVDAARFLGTILLNSPPLIVLAGCATAVPGRAPDGDPLPALAQQLVLGGTPAVLAMRSDVTDRYATDFAARFFAALAESDHPDPVSALAAARRLVEMERRSEIRGPRLAPEWSTPTLFSAEPSTLLFEPKSILETHASGSKTRDRLEPYRSGEFIGRRREMRWLFQAFKQANPTCVVIHGIGGIGKSALAHRFLERLAAAGRMVISLSARDPVDELLKTVARRLLEEHDLPLRELTTTLSDRNLTVDHRLDLLLEHVLQAFDLVILLDDFEGQLDEEGQVGDGVLRSFLERWIESDNPSRFIITSRKQVRWPANIQHRAAALALPPLSPAETRKLFWRLPALESLLPEDLHWIYDHFGGHPLALRLVADALGKRATTSVLDHLKALLDEDKSSLLAETVSTLASHTAVEPLLSQLDPQTKNLLFGTSVYRLPVDRSGLALQIAENVEDLDSTSRLPDVVLSYPATIYSRTRPHELALVRGIGPIEKSEHGTPKNADHVDLLLNQLVRLGFLAVFSPDPGERGEDRYLVHRWLSGFLERRWPDDLRRKAHQRAAIYWRRRARESIATEPVQALLEARFHYRQALQIETAVEVTRWLCAQLHVWSEWAWEGALAQETLRWLPDRHRETAAFQHQLGLIAHEQGRYGEARSWYEKSLETSVRLEDKASEAATLHQLGILARSVGQLNDAERLLEAALKIKEALGSSAAIASTLHELAGLEKSRGQLTEAEALYARAIEIEERVGDAAGKAKGLHQLANLLLVRGGEDQRAEALYREAASISSQLGDRASLASSLHQLAVLTQQRQAYDEAFSLLYEALDIERAIGDRASLANTQYQLGHLARAAGSGEEAGKAYGEALGLYEELRDLHGVARASYQLGLVHQEQNDLQEAERWFRRSAEHLMQLEVQEDLARTLFQLGTVLAARGQLAEAEANLQQAGDMFQALGSGEETISAHRRLGRLLLQRINSDDENAADAAKLARLARVLALANCHGDRQLAAAALQTYGNLLEKESLPAATAIEIEIAKLDLGEPAVAVELAIIRCIQNHYREAIDLARPITEMAARNLPTTLRIRAFYSLGEARLALGLDDGLTDLERGLDIARRANNRPLLAEGYLRCGNSRLLRQDFEDARLAYLMAASVYQRLDLPEKVALCYRLLILLSREVGREKDADNFRQTAREYFDGIGHPEWLQELPAKRQIRA